MRKRQVGHIRRAQYPHVVTTSPMLLMQVNNDAAIEVHPCPTWFRVLEPHYWAGLLWEQF